MGLELLPLDGELKKEELKAIGLDKLMQVFWDNEKGIYITENKKIVEAEAFGPVLSIVTWYDVKSESTGYDPYLGGTGYKVSRKFHSAKIYGGDPSILRIASYYMLGSSFYLKDWPPKDEAKITTFTLLMAK